MTLMVQAFSLKLGCSTRKLILLKLADNANDEGHCWPSYQHIADMCEIDKRTAMRHVKKLEEMGYLTKDTRTRKHGYTSNMYHLKLDKPSSDNLSLGGSDTRSLGSDTRSLGGSDRVSPRISHSLEPVIEPKDLVENEFDHLWKVWPNTKNKKKSLAAFIALCKKNPKQTPEFIRTSLVQDVKTRIANKQFAFENTMLSSYLNGERWNDGHETTETRKDPLLEAMGL